MKYVPCHLHLPCSVLLNVLVGRHGFGAIYLGSPATGPTCQQAAISRVMHVRGTTALDIALSCVAAWLIVPGGCRIARFCWARFRCLVSHAILVFGTQIIHGHRQIIQCRGDAHVHALRRFSVERKQDSVHVCVGLGTHSDQYQAGCRCSCVMSIDCPSTSTCTGIESTCVFRWLLHQ